MYRKASDRVNAILQCQERCLQSFPKKKKKKKAQLMQNFAFSGIFSCSSYDTVICLGEIKLRVMESLGDKSSSIDKGGDFTCCT
jgi:hypothetical protein